MPKKGRRTERDEALGADPGGLGGDEDFRVSVFGFPGGLSTGDRDPYSASHLRPTPRQDSRAFPPI